MSSIGECLYRQAFKEGWEEGIVISIQAISDNLKMKTEQVMELLEVSKDEYDKYKELLKNYSTERGA